MTNQRKQKDPKKIGDINISPNAIATVAGIAAMQCFGVVGMVSHNIQDELSELLSVKDNLTKGIDVRIAEDESVTIDLYVVVEYGVRLREVGRNVMGHVKYVVEKQLGLHISEVNVIIQGVRVNRKN